MSNVNKIFETDFSIKEIPVNTAKNSNRGSLNGRKISKTQLLKEIANNKASVMEKIESIDAESAALAQKNLNNLNIYAEKRNKSFLTRIRRFINPEFKGYATVDKEIIAKLCAKVLAIQAAVDKPKTFKAIQVVVAELNRRVEADIKKDAPKPQEALFRRTKAEGQKEFNKELRDNPLIDLSGKSQTDLASSIKQFFLESDIFKDVRERLNKVDLSDKDKAIKEYQEIFQSMSAEDRSLCKDLAILMNNVYEFGWKHNAKDISAFLVAVPFLKLLYEKGIGGEELKVKNPPHVIFILENTNNIFS